MWQASQEGEGGGGREQQQRALAIASTPNAAAAAAAAAVASSSSPEDAAFADVLAETMQGHLSPAEAVREYALICERAADAARREAQGLSDSSSEPSLQGAAAAATATAAPSSAAARRAAAARSSALESEAATWRLLFWLQGDPDPCVPAGRVVDAFGSKKAAASLSSPLRLLSAPASSSSPSLSSLTGAQRAALVIAYDPTLNRLARVVAWLEASARRALAADDEGAAAAGGVAGGGDALLFPGDGLPRDTGLRTRAAELDPDAGTRALLGAGVAIGGAGGTRGTATAAAASQHWSRADDEASARLCSRLRCLLRAGRGRDAVALCSRVGAHWRGVSMGSAAGPGLVALGEEVAEGNENDGGGAGDAADALAAEADLGAGPLRALWRSAAAAAAASASATAAAAPPGSAAEASAGAEAALCGVLGGDPAAALLLLLGGGGGSGGGVGGDGRPSSSSSSSPTQSQRLFAAASDSSSSSALPARPSPWHDALWVLARCWLEAEVDAVVASSSFSNSNSSCSNHRCEGVVAGSQGKKAWPPRHLADAVPRSPGELLSAAAAAAAAPSRGGGSLASSLSLAAAEAHSGAQEALIAGGEALLAFVADRLPRWAGAGAVAAGEGSKEAAATAAGAAQPHLRGGARFAAHFALALADLGLIPDPADPSPPPAAARRVVDAANAAIALHCVSLIDSGSSASGNLDGENGNNGNFVDAGNLLPPLAARAAAPFRRDIIGLRLRTLRDAPAEDAAQALEALDQWLQGWASTVAAANANATSSSSSSSVFSPPVSDIVPGEMERHAAAAAASGRSAGSSREGPAGRAAAARWLWLSPRTLPAAAEHTCRVLRELFLSGGGGAASAARALLAGLPEEPAAVVELAPTEILEAAEELRSSSSSSSAASAAASSSRRAVAALAALGPNAARLAPKTFSCLAELAAWRALFLADRAWRAWRADYAAAEAARPSAPSAAALARLRSGAESLAEDLPGLVASRWLQACLGKGDSEDGENALVPREPVRDGEPGEVALELLLELLPSSGSSSDGDRRRRGGNDHERKRPREGNDHETSAAAADAADDSRYRLSSPEACAAGAAALSASLSAALPEGVVATAAPAEGADAGLVAVRVRLAEGGGASAVAAAAFAAAVVKGTLAPASASPSSAAALASSPPRVRVACLRAASGEAAAALCTAVALPALLLRAAAAREAAIALGSGLDPGTAAVELAADAEVAPLFSRGEVQSLLERERRAVISAMVNDEAKKA